MPLNKDLYRANFTAGMYRHTVPELRFEKMYLEKRTGNHACNHCQARRLLSFPALGTGFMFYMNDFRMTSFLFLVIGPFSFEFYTSFI